jgi:hypothetical protein
VETPVTNLLVCLNEDMQEGASLGSGRRGLQRGLRGVD